MKKLTIFDLDDTLITSEAKIRVYDSETNKEIATFTPSQFNHHIMYQKCYYSFKEFDSMQILENAKIHKPILSSLKRYLKMSDDVCILTARESKKLIIDFFETKNCHLNRDLVYAVGGTGYNGSVPERKKQALKELIKKGYTNFRVYDDNVYNIRALKSLEDDNIKIKTIQVLHGKTKKRRDNKRARKPVGKGRL